MGLFQIASDVPLARHRRSYFFKPVCSDILPDGWVFGMFTLYFPQMRKMNHFLEATHAV